MPPESKKQKPFLGFWQCKFKRCWDYMKIKCVEALVSFGRQKDWRKFFLPIFQGVLYFLIFSCAWIIFITKKSPTLFFFHIIFLKEHYNERRSYKICPWPERYRSWRTGHSYMWGKQKDSKTIQKITRMEEQQLHNQNKIVRRKIYF